jgi:hypothetical protein
MQRRAPILKTLNPATRLLTAAADRLSAIVGRAVRLAAGALVVAAWGHGALAADGSGGREGLSSVPSAKMFTGSLTYTNFGGSSCSETAFFTAATAHLNIAGFSNGAGSTTLNGLAYDVFVPNLGQGPDSFNTTFSRAFNPPVASSTYTFVFKTVVTSEGRLVGTSVTTVECAGGGLSAISEWQPYALEVPAGQPATWVALTLLLAVAGARLARRRA